MSIKNYGVNIHSQNFEDGILQECMKRLKIKTGHVIESGAHNGFYCSNTRLLIEQGFTAILIEADEELFKQIPDEPNVMSFNEFVTPENVNEIFPQKAVLASLDFDGTDYLIWKAYTGKPDIVIIEINSSLDPSEDYFTPEKGANYSIMKKLAESKGYFVLCHTGNLVCVLNKHAALFPDKDETFNTSWLK
jgi:hypothetical protein